MACCRETLCKDYAQEFPVPGSAIGLWIGNQNGKPFSVLIYDNRTSEPDHMHFGIWDLRAMAREVEAMVTDGVVIPTDETGRSHRTG